MVMLGVAAFHDGYNEDKMRENKHNKEIHQVHVQIEKNKERLRRQRNTWMCVHISTSHSTVR